MKGSDLDTEFVLPDANESINSFQSEPIILQCREISVSSAVDIPRLIKRHGTLCSRYFVLHDDPRVHRPNGLESIVCFDQMDRKI